MTFITSIFQPPVFTMSITPWSKTFDNTFHEHRFGRHRALTNGAGWSVDDYPGKLNPGQTSVSGFRDTDWKIKVAKQQNAAMTYTRNGWRYMVPYSIQAGGTVQYVSTKYWSEMSRVTNFSTNQLSGSTDAALADLAVARFKRKLSGRLGNAEALVPLVETRELGKTIRATASASTEFVLRLAEARKTRGLSLYRYFQDQWLNYSFGIAPMISDTMAILDSINNYLDRPKGLHRIRSVATKRWFTGYNSTVGDFGPLYGWNLKQYASINHTLKYTIDSGINFSLICGNDYSLRSHLGLEDLGGALPSLIWETFPFSWVFDYFTTIGAYIDDTFVLPNGSTVYLTRTRLYTADGYELPSLEGSSRFKDHSLNFCRVLPGFWSYFMVQREVLSALPHRALRFKTQDEVGKMAVNKLLNLTSLLKGGTRGKR